jgi:dolichol-phosphate mannosyltransferase
MDADMQHDEKLLPQMLATLKSEPVDLVVGSRYIAGGGIGGWNPARASMSASATRLSRLICKAEIADPMSGFFMLRREVLEGALRRLSGEGFKLLLDILASSPQSLRLRELPYEFRERQRGESKLDTLVAWEYIMLIADKLVGHIVPVRFALFAFVGGNWPAHPHVDPVVCAHRGRGDLRSGASLCFRCGDDVEFLPQQPVHLSKPPPARSSVAARARHFLCDLRPGSVANVGIAGYVFSRNEVWWLAGLVDVAVGSVWNYAVSSVFTWKQK